MKVLSVAWAIYDSRIESFCGNCTGAGLVIKNLCEYIGKTEQSYLYVGQYDIEDIKLGNINIVSNILENDAGRFNARVDRVIWKFEKILKELKPDIVNVHGIGEMAIRCIYICKRNKIPCVFVEHLYIGLNKTFQKYDRDVEWEKELYNISNLNIVTVSTGMKKKILNDYSRLNPENLTVVRNGTDFSAKLMESDLRTKYSVQNKKVLLCVGNITERKNQLQLIDSYKLLPEYVRDEVAIFFCGIDRINGKLEERINKENLQNELIYVGAVSIDEMKKFYSIADGLIMPSLAEGLSIAALEAIAYGLPVIMSAKSECADDLSDENVSVLAKTQESSSIAEAITTWFNKKWDRKYIMKCASNFTMENMAEQYIELNKKVIENERYDCEHHMSTV